MPSAEVLAKLKTYEVLQRRQHDPYGAIEFLEMELKKNANFSEAQAKLLKRNLEEAQQAAKERALKEELH